jgi:hypothetical protein
MGMTDRENIVNSKRVKMARLDDENGEVYKELQAHIKGFAMDTTGPRLNLLIAHLMAAGVMSEEQWLDFEIEFHEKVKAAMEKPLSELQTAKRRQGLAVVREPRKSGLVDRTGKPLT